MNDYDCTNNIGRILCDCQVHTSVLALMAESVTTMFTHAHWAVTGNGRLIAGNRSFPDRTNRMVSGGYVS